ncbi:MAG: subunit of NADH:ubiquinone oxidoreductase [Chloroflexi bacterium]|nr:subunit of NADH:ubiquinone oxidoreductase [Chloroflexota bacterium]
MTAVTRRPTLPARALLAGVLLLLVGGLVITLAAVLLLPPLVDFLAANTPLVRFAVAALVLLLITIPVAFIVIYMELKVIARMNLRVGPDRVGPFGAAQSVVHGLKVLAKEDFTPFGVDVAVYTLAPVAVFLTTLMTILVVPFAPGLYGQDFNIGLLYVFAIGGLNVVGLMMAGWGSFNKYSLLGALRAAAQAISYEIPLALAVVGVIILAGTMSLNSIVEQQAGTVFDWNLWRQPLGLVIFFIAAIAEANRTPLDMTEADQELVAGFATEYSGMRFGFFFFAEYVNVFVVSCLVTVLFFGGWNAPFDWPFPVAIDLDPAGYEAWLAFLLVAGPIVGTVALAALLRFFVDWMRWPGALLIAFLLVNLLAVGALVGLAFVTFDWVVGLTWMMVKSFAFVFTFVWLRATLPRVRVDQLMGVAWKWLLPAALVNIFVTAAAVVLVWG